MMKSAAGTAAATEAVDLALSSTVPPGTIAYPTGNWAFNAWTFARRASTTVAGSTFAIRSLWTVSVGFRSRRQLKERNCAPIWNGNLQGPQCIRRYSVLLVGSRDDVDQVDPVTHLRDV